MVGNFIWSLLVDSESSESLYSSSVEAWSEGDKEEVNQTEYEFEPPIPESEFELEPMEEMPTKKPRSEKRKRQSKSDRPKKKKKILEEEEKAGGDYSKTLFERIWSNDEEITILEGMIEYSKKGLNPYGDLIRFVGSRKYETNVAKGKKYNHVKPHELKVFDLSKKVWGSGEGSFVFGRLSEEYKCNETCACLRELRLLEGCLGSIEEPKRSELKEEWKKLHIAELELLVRRSEFKRNKAKLILEALK
ncbi:probable transcription factor At1g11510 [Prunus avium]|uniref:Probable transcription factor At1g11510 n=1 Tax=Prunus avium TaxID=42229 RepID=A0A6P5U379_PRUAV|nr:probable transcription factor At1g11510 [Prunus avium]